MNKQARLNYINALSQNVEHKKMYKAKKQWVVAGISFLVATGLGAVGSHLTTRADTTQAKAQTNLPINNREQNSGSASNPTEKQASNLVGKLINNQTKHVSVSNSQPTKDSATPASNKVSGSQVSSSNAKSSVSSNVVNSGNSMNTLKLGNSSEQNKGWNYIQSGIKPSANSKVSSTSQISSKKNKPMMLFGNAAPTTSNGATVYPDGTVKGTWGTAPWTLKGNTLNIGSDTGAQTNMKTNVWPQYFTANVKNYQGVDIINVNNVKAPIDSSHLFTANSWIEINSNNAIVKNQARNLKVKVINLNHFNTSDTTNMSNMFDSGSLQEINGLNNINTHNVQTMYEMFASCGAIHSLDLSNFDTQSLQGLDFSNAINGYGNNQDTADGWMMPGNECTHIKIGKNTVLDGAAGMSNKYPWLNEQTGDIVTGLPWEHNENNKTVNEAGNWFNVNHAVANGNWDKNDKSSALWLQDQHGNLFISHGWITKNINQGYGINWPNIKHVYISNNVTLKDGSSLGRFNDDLSNIIQDYHSTTNNKNDMNNISQHDYNSDKNIVTNDANIIDTANSNIATYLINPTDSDANSANNDASMASSAYNDANVENLIASQGAKYSADIDSINSLTNSNTKLSQEVSYANSGASNADALDSAIINVLSNGSYKSSGLNTNDTALLGSLISKYNNWNQASNNTNVLVSALNDVARGSSYASNSALTNTDYSLLSSMSADYSRWNSASTSAQSGSIQAQSASSQADSASKSISNFVASLSVSSGASLTIQNAIDSAESSANNEFTTQSSYNKLFSNSSGNSLTDTITSAAKSVASSIASFYANSYAQSMFGSADSNGTVSNVVSSLASSITTNYVSNSTFDNLSTELSNYNTVASSATSAYNSVSSAFSTLGLNSSGSYNSSSNTVLSRLSAIETNLGSASSIGTQLSSIKTQLTSSSSSNTIASEVAALNSALGKNLSNASSAISWVETNGTNVSNSAASALASAGTNNSLINHINNLSDDNTNLKKAIDGLNNANVEVFYVDKTGKLLSDNGQPAKPQQNVAATPKVLGTLGSLRSGKINLLNSVPMGYHLNPAQKFQLLRNKKHELGASRVSKQAVLLGSYDPNKQSSQSGNTTSPYIVTYGNYVQYHGTITLKFKSNGRTINSFEIPYTSGVGQVGSDLPLFNPNKYINQTSFVDVHGNTHKVNDIKDFTLNSSDASPVSISDIQPAKNLSSDSSKPTTMTDNQSHVLNFTANSATDKFSYVIDTPSGYNGVTSLTGSSASSSINGQYDAKVTSGTIKAPSGYSIATSNNGEPTTYNNGTNYQVHITPDNENVDIIYQDADKNGSIIDNGKSSNKISDNVHVPYRAYISDVTKTFNIPSNYELASSSATKRIEATKSNQSITLDIKCKPASQIINGGKSPKPDIPPAPTSDTNPESDTTNPLNPNSKDNNGADKANTKNGIATINIVLENSKGKNIKEYAKTVDVYKNHQIGTTYSINPNDDTLKPTGYEEATNPSSTPLKGTVNSDGSLNNGVGYFYYQAIPSQIKQIEVTFVNQKGVRIGSNGKPSSSYVQTLSDNTLASIGGVGTTFNIIPHLTAPTGYHFAKTGANSTFNITIQKGTGAVGLTFRLLSSAPKPNSNANKPSGSASINMNSAQLSSFADEIGTHITITPQSAVNETVDGSALNSLASEVATNNQEISNLANKPTSAASTNINYDYFNNLINNGVSRLTNAINKDFKSNIKHVHAKTLKPKKTVGKRTRTYSYLKWLRVVKPLKLYNNKHEAVKVIKPRHRITLNVKAAYKVHNHIVFKISYKHHNYLIKANNKAIKNAYLPASKKLVGRKVRVIYNVYANKHKTSGRVKTLHKGYKSTIKHIVRIGNHNVTRIQLADGLWISANMNYVKVL